MKLLPFLRSSMVFYFNMWVLFSYNATVTDTKIVNGNTGLRSAKIKVTIFQISTRNRKLEKDVAII